VLFCRIRDQDENGGTRQSEISCQIENRNEEAIDALEDTHFTENENKTK
jgi:hypothetical protein